MTTDLIGSARLTCDFNNDFRCGIYDMQFGTVAPVTGVPEPPSALLVLSGLAAIRAGLTLYRRRTT